MTHLKRSAIFLLALTMLLAACGSSTSTPAATSTTTTASVAGDFVGVSNQEDFIGLSTNGQQLIAYACDGFAKHSLTYAVWFKGAVSHNAASLTAANSSRLVVTWTAQEAVGTVTLSSGHSFSFTAPAVSATGLGLYRGEETFAGVSYLAGWIVAPKQAAISAPTSVTLLSVGAQLTHYLGGCGICSGPNGPQVENPRGGILNEQTGVLLAVPSLTTPDIVARRMTVPNLGTFTMVLCRQAQC